MKKTFYELAVANPGVVSWYCGLKLEMAIHLTKNLLTQQMQSQNVPGLAEVKRRLQTTLREKIGQDVSIDSLPDLKSMGHVDDFYASFEWSSGGMLHAHMAFWIVGSPRIDKVVVPSRMTRLLKSLPRARPMLYSRKQKLLISWRVFGTG